MWYTRGHVHRQAYRLDRHLLQSYLWQEYDLAPNFPALRRFLDFWAHNLDGRLHSVKVAGQQLIQAPETRFASAYLRLQ